jgi:hypothetical protein
MGIFDALTGAAGHQAAQNQRNTLGAIIPNLAQTGQTGYGQAQTALQQGFAGARDDLTGGYFNGTGAINTGASGAQGYLDQGQAGAFGQLGQARSDLTANGGAFAPLSALAGRYGQGAGLYADALGINGAGGNQRAQDAFTPSMSYNFNMDQGLEALNRRRNMAGTLNGGNADRDAQIFGSGLASREMGSWLDRLQGFNPLELSATQGAATGNQANNNTLAGLGVAGAGLANTGGQNRAAVSAAQGNSLADLAMASARGQAGLDTGEGGALAGNYTGGAQNWQSVFQNALKPWNETHAADANASNQASANSLKLGMDLAKLAAGAGGGGSFMPSSSFQNNSWGW